MKKITLLTLIVALFTITGCKKDKDNDKENSSSIQGRWLATSLVEISYENGVEEGRDDDTSDNLWVEFKADGTGMSQTDRDGQSSFTYTIKNNELVIKFEDETDKYQIKSLTNSDLHLYQEESETSDGVVYKEVVEIKLKKR